MKLIHCADLHLDSKMESNFSAQQSKERRAELFETFSSMVEYAKKHEVSVIIIAGDMFDTKNSQIRIKRRVCDLIRSASGIDFLYLTGNHDNSDFLGSAECPENLKFFGETWACYKYGDIDIWGCDSGEEIYALPELTPQRRNIVVLHGQETFGNVTGDGLVNIPAFAHRYIDYLALGHLHTYKCGNIDDRGIYCYCGCLEGRGFDECGEKGFVLIDADESGVRHEFIPFARRTLHTVEVDLEGVVTNAEITERINRELESVPSDDLVKIVLTGDVDEQTDIDETYIQRQYEPRFYFVKVYDRTALHIDYENYRNDISLKGEFVRLVSAQVMDETRKKEIILTGLKALAGREIDI